MVEEIVEMETYVISIIFRLTQSFIRTDFRCKSWATASKMLPKVAKTATITSAKQQDTRLK